MSCAYEQVNMLRWLLHQLPACRLDAQATQAAAQHNHPEALEFLLSSNLRQPAPFPEDLHGIGRCCGLLLVRAGCPMRHCAAGRAVVMQLVDSWCVLLASWHHDAGRPVEISATNAVSGNVN